MRAVVDNFVDDFEGLRAHCDSLNYEGAVNPIDGVLYPGISLDIPESVVVEIAGKLSKAVGLDLTGHLMFIRMTDSDTVPPHHAHNDAVMGDYGMLLYLNRSEHCTGGTSFVRHIATGMDGNPKDLEQEAIWKRDTNTDNAWEVLEMVEMKPNRALIFDTRDMHRAEPVTGFGNSAENGRLVLTCFARAA